MKVLAMRLRGLFAVSLMLLPLAASATNGYFLIGYGAKSRGMGGVATAYADDSLAAAGNPALMADVNGDDLQVQPENDGRLRDDRQWRQYPLSPDGAGQAGLSERANGRQRKSRHRRWQLFLQLQL
jgi:hypothetical protein